jgi:hypothetical protein
MAVPTGGLLAFDARGSIGKTIVYSTWRGRNYVRRHVIPANPQTGPQMSNRDIFRWLQQAWKEAAGQVQDNWFAAARGRPVTDRNLFTQFNLKALQGMTDLTGFTFSNGAAAGISLATAVFSSTGAGNIHAVMTSGALPIGWTLQHYFLAAIRQQDPHSGLLYRSYAVEGAASPLDLAGLATGTYVVGAFANYVKPAGNLAWGPAIMGVQAVA